MAFIRMYPKISQSQMVLKEGIVSNNDMLKLLKQLTGEIYPIALTVIQNAGTFFLSYGFFKGCLLLKDRITKQLYI